MIQSFRNKRVECFYRDGVSKGLPADHLKRLKLRLDTLDQALSLDDVNTPGSHFHPLTGDMAGRYSVRVTGNWRLPFGWDEDGATAIDVDYEDYH